MKQLILFLLLSISIFAQTNGILVGGGAVWTDSLGYGEVAASDSVWILNTNFAHDEYRFFLKGNANSPVDSVGLQLGSVRYSGNVPVDTVWGSYTGLIIAAGTIAVRMVNTTSGADFKLESPAQLLKLVLLNKRATLATRNVTITINAKK